MHLVFTGGGTGGHILPNIAIINELRRLKVPTSHRGSVKSEPQFEISYIGTVRDRALVSQYGAGAMNFYAIQTGKLRRYFDIQNFIDFFKIPIGFFQAIRILRRLKPTLVFSKGGYVSVPVVLAAAALRIPVWLHESDVTPGLSTRICKGFATKIFLSFEESLPYFKNCRATMQVVGNPIRASILNGDKKKGFSFTKFSSKLPVILIMGGSSGAQSLNIKILEALPELLKHYQVIHVTGELFAHDKKLFSAFGKNPHLHRFDFIGPELADVYAITDLIISRAGSGSIFEALALQKPLILIPLPTAGSRGDQIENAEIFKKHRWAEVIFQEKIDRDFLIDTIKKSLNKKAFAKNPPLSGARQKYTDAAQKIAEAIDQTYLALYNTNC